MARGSSQKGPGGTSRFRFVLFEGDLQEGELAQVTQAIQSAFRQPQTPAPRAIVRSPSEALISPDDVSDAAEFVDSPEDVFAVAASPPKAKTPRKARSGKVPNLVNDIDVKTDPSLKDFVAQYDARTGFEKYLVVALWLRDARSVNSFTVDHVYTCFRMLNWSTNSSDFSKPLRNLADNGLLSGDSKGYSLTLPGAGKIEDKKRSAE